VERRSFVGKTGCGFAGLMASSLAMGGGQAAAQTRRKRYQIEVEIFETPADSRCHKKGEKYSYPQDWGKVCPWLRAAMIEPIRLLEWGVTLPWKYEGTPYEKVIDPDGVTTEFIRCPDPTAKVVAKIIRTPKA